MPLQNRVTPLGSLVAHPARGLVYGNRGCLHDSEGRIRRSYDGSRWIACLLEFKGRRRTLLRPGRYTELFFLDEATAFAAGHRPCAECRRADYRRVLELTGARGADELDARLHAERLSRERRTAAVASLPTATFVAHAGLAHVVTGDELRPWSPSGYGPPVRADGPVEILTPPTLVDVLASGWRGLVPLLADDERHGYDDAAAARVPDVDAEDVPAGRD
jgi:hypothetical protein